MGSLHSEEADLLELNDYNENRVTGKDKHEISKMAINHCYSKFEKMNRINDEKFDSIRSLIIPKFCYQNAFDTAKHLNATHIVYGLALNYLGSICISAEHAWLQLGSGQMVDPTYQLLQEQDSLSVAVRYYSLLAIPIENYAIFAKRLGFCYGEFLAMDFFWLRSSHDFRHLFTSK